MPRQTRGSVYRCKNGLGIRWMVAGERHHRSGFPSEGAARAWFEQNVLAHVRPKIQDACEQMREWAWTDGRTHRRKDLGSWVYVVVAAEVQRIKIGRTTVPRERMATFRTGSPVEIQPLLMTPGGVHLERALLEITKPWMIPGVNREWRTIEALEVVFAFIREQAKGSNLEDANAEVSVGPIRSQLRLIDGAAS